MQTDLSIQTVIPILDPSKIRQGRAWTDKCGHNPDSYIGTILLPPCQGSGKAVWLDVYAFIEQHSGRSEVCARYGDANQDYLSPGTILDIIVLALTHQDPLHLNLAGLLLAKLKCNWIKRL